jgi:hypothetical protein
LLTEALKLGKIEAKKGEVTPRNKAISAPILHNNLGRFRDEMPAKWCLQGTSSEAKLVPWKSRLGGFAAANDLVGKSDVEVREMGENDQRHGCNYSTTRNTEGVREL